nr:serine/threonine-protein kinase [uncultured Holophaga sp.]
MEETQNGPLTVGRYEIRKRLGSGAMGSVYLAEDPRIKRKLAIKVVRLDAIRSEADRQDFLMRFQREAEVSGLLNDPGIVTIYDVGDSEVGPFLAMEYVPGHPLDALLKSGEISQLDLTAKLRIAAGIASALDHAHAHGIIHRDVKPGNVILTEEGRPKLMDFGIAKREDASLTQTGTFLGTPAYASPEQIREGKSTFRSDIFSFGVLVFELLSGGLPFPGSSINTILYRIVNEAPAEVLPPVPGLAEGAWQKVFGRVLAKRPEERFDSCGAFVRALVDSVNGLAPEARLALLQGLRQIPPFQTGIQLDQPPPPSPQETTALPRSHRSLALPLGIGALVVILGAGFFAYRSRRGGLVTLVTHPAEARVIRDGKVLGTTPLGIKASQGDHFRIEHKGYEPMDYTFTKGGPTSLDLKALRTRERLQTDPPGALVVMDTVALPDPTPTTVEWDQGKRHELTFTRGDRGYSQLFLEGETPSGKVFALQPQAAAPPAPAEPVDNAQPASLVISAAYPFKARIDGRDTGELRSGSPLKLPAGSHRLEIASPKVFFRDIRTLTLKPGQTLQLPLPEVSSLTVSTFPAAGIIVIDGVATGVESDGSVPIPVTRGRHTVGIAGHPESQRVVEVAADLTVKFKL